MQSNQSAWGSTVSSVFLKASVPTMMRVAEVDLNVGRAGKMLAVDHLTEILHQRFYSSFGSAPVCLVRTVTTISVSLLGTFSSITNRV